MPGNVVEATGFKYAWHHPDGKSGVVNLHAATREEAEADIARRDQTANEEIAAREAIARHNVEVRQRQDTMWDAFKGPLGMLVTSAAQEYKLSEEEVWDKIREEADERDSSDTFDRL